jgi:hypothetical protein
MVALRLDRRLKGRVDGLSSDVAGRGPSRGAVWERILARYQPDAQRRSDPWPIAAAG